MISSFDMNTRSASDPILGDLNPVQHKAVRHEGGPLLILACAGSGKTRVLTRRIAWLVRERRVRPDRILALTFTNKAAGEMVQRIEVLLNLPVRGLWIGTFHSICLRWLRRHYREAGYQAGLSVFDTDDQRALMRRLLKEEGFEEKTRRVRDVLSIISRAKSGANSPEQMQAAARTPAEILSARIYAAYQRALRQQNAADFDDLLLVAHRLFETHPEIVASYGQQFEHILVDEYQDTNLVQFRLVERLSRDHRRIFVVGDDDQSIYGWRGADVTNIIDFSEHFPDATVLRMEQNYRSTGSIIAFANAVIRGNKSRWAKRLWTAREEGQKPDLLIAADEDAEAEEIASRISAVVASGEQRHGEIALFYRTHAQSRPLEDAFLRRRIPYQLVGGVTFYQRREIKDLMSYLRVLVNPVDEVSLRRAISVPRRGIGDRTMSGLLNEARERRVDPLDIAANGELALARGKARKELVAFGKALKGWRARLGEPPELILSEIIGAIDFTGYLQRQGDNWEERVANVDELIEGARYFSSRYSGGIREYLDQVSLMTNLDNVKDEGEYVTLMTAHTAKGLEFPRVFITGLEEGLFPHASAYDDKEEMEEERRLFYVACTRAMDRLTLSACLMRRRTTVGAGGLSRFLSEVDLELYEETELQAHYPSAAAPRGCLDNSRSGGGRSRAVGRHRGGGERFSREAAGGFDQGGSASLDHPLVGRRVFHATFGPGLVVAAEGKGEQAHVSVRFHSGRTRRVLGAYLEWEA